MLRLPEKVVDRQAYLGELIAQLFQPAVDIAEYDREGPVVRLELLDDERVSRYPSGLPSPPA